MSQAKKQELVEKEQSTDLLPSDLALFDRDKLKSLFYLFVAKPDSRIQIFKKTIIVEPSDIENLNDEILRKLNTHQIDTLTCSLSVHTDNGRYIEFADITDFIRHPWNEPDLVSQLVVCWDFLCNIKGYKAPQRHTLTLRISSEMKPAKFMQLAASGNADDFEELDLMTCPAFCRVDFINASLSRELINLVTDWYNVRKEPDLIPKFYYTLKKYRHGIAVFTHNFVPIVFAAAWCGLLAYLLGNEFVLESNTLYVGAWLLFGFVFGSMFNRFGHLIASKFYTKLQNLDGNKVVFKITAGDIKDAAQKVKQNSKRGFSITAKLAVKLVFEAIILYISYSMIPS